VKEDDKWPLFSPAESHALMATADFRRKMASLVSEGKVVKWTRARDIMGAILRSQRKTGEPYMLNRDTINSRSPVIVNYDEEDDDDDDKKDETEAGETEYDSQKAKMATTTTCAARSKGERGANMIRKTSIDCRGDIRDNKKRERKRGTSIRSSNLCTEIVQFSDETETSVCTVMTLCFPSFVRYERSTLSPHTTENDNDDDDDSGRDDPQVKLAAKGKREKTAQRANWTGRPGPYVDWDGLVRAAREAQRLGDCLVTAGACTFEKLYPK